MIEFVVDFPQKRRGYLKMALTVWLHLLFIIITVVPIYVAVQVKKSEKIKKIPRNLKCFF